MIDDEVRDVLKELVEEIGAISARIVDDDTNTRLGVPAKTLALGGGEYLRVELPTRVDRSARQDEGQDHDIEAAFEKVTRQLRAIRRRYEVSRLPEVTVAPGAAPSGSRVIHTIEKYMQGLASIDRASHAFVTR